MELVQVSRPRPGVCQLTLAPPEALNTMTAPLVAEPHTQLEAIERDPQCRVLVLTGAGGPSAPAWTFAATAATSWLKRGERSGGRRFRRVLHPGRFSARDLGTSWLLPRIVGTAGRA